MAQLALATAGAVIGGLVTGWSPQGMQAGFMLGACVGDRYEAIDDSPNHQQLKDSAPSNSTAAPESPA